MKHQQGYKYRLNLPTGAATRLSQQAGCVRVVWNRAVALSKDKYPGFKSLCALLPIWKQELPWLAEADSIALQQSLRNFDRAWQNFFKYPEHYDRPTFKKRGDRDFRMEDLRLVHMMKSAKGTIEEPGKNVAQKRGLSRHLADQGLRQLRTFIEYKLAWSGGSFEAIDPKYTSQRCHACKHTARENRVSQASLVCGACGHTDHADVNAAKNIRDTAVGAIAVKVPPRRRRKSPACDVHIPNAA